MALRTGDLIMDLFKRSPKWMDLQGEVPEEDVTITPAAKVCGQE